MKRTTLEEKLTISAGVNDGKSYKAIADELHLTERVVRKWGQKVKKKYPLICCDGSPDNWFIK